MTELQKVEYFIQKGYTYNPETGEIKDSRGKITDNRNISGYVKITTSQRPEGGEKRKIFQVYSHRFAWYYMYGELPKYTIDHINAVRWDNRIINLRVLEHKDNTSLRIGRGWVAYPSKKWGVKYHAQIRIGGATKFLGSFYTPEEARAAYLGEKMEILANISKTFDVNSNI